MGTNGNFIANGKVNIVNNYWEPNDEAVNDQLIELIRKRANSSKSWNDLAKLSRTYLNEKRHPVTSDLQEKNQLQKCLDTIQKSIKVTSLQSMIERLETITRQLGLKFTSNASGKNVFISSDMFYVEVVLDPNNGFVKDVKIAHQGEPISCPELTDVLRKADFVEFNKHLNGLSAIYQLNADKKQKMKAYTALNALEQDLNILSKLQSSINEPNKLIHKSPVGILEQRKGGRPMKLTYFISPYDLIDEKRKVSLPLSVEIITEKKLGFSSTVCLESSSLNKLQTVSLITITKTHGGKSLPQFSAFNNQNSQLLPAYFVLKLPETLPLSLEIMNKIKQETGLDVVYTPNSQQSLLGILAKKMLPKKELVKMKSVEDPFFVKLPDQCHTYYFNNSVSSIMGVEATSIPFAHPTFVPIILNLLRQQVLFNVLLGSCLRQLYKNELKKDNPLMFEITALSITSINVSFEHPVEETLATIDFDLEEITNIKAKLYDSQSFSTYCSDEFASIVMQRCFSIPVTMRSVIKKCQDKVALLKEELRKKQAQLMQQVMPNDLYYNSSNNEKKSENFNSLFNQKIISNDSSDRSKNCNATINKFDNFHQSKNNNSINLQNILQQNSNQRVNYQQSNRNFQQQNFQQKSNTMLMTMLSDVPAANSQGSLNNSSNNYFSQNNTNNLSQLQQQVPKVKKQRKRKGQEANIKSPSSCGRSPKRKISEDDFSKDLSSISSDYNDNSFENFQLANQLSRPSSSTSSNSNQFSSIKQENDGDVNNKKQLNDFNENSNFNQNNFKNNFLNSNNFLDNAASFDFKRKKVSDNLSFQQSDKNLNNIVENEQQLILKSLEDLHSHNQDTYSQKQVVGSKSYSTIPSIKNSNNSSLAEKRNSLGSLETILKDSNLQKKERKRKKAEILDSKNILSSMIVSNMQLMPPPSLVSGSITASSPTSSTNSNAYVFVDMETSNSTLSSPALRPITLNVKPSLNTGNLNFTGVKLNEKSISNKLKQGSPKTECDLNVSNFSPKSSPKSSPKVSKTSKPKLSNLGLNTISPKNQNKQSSLKFKTINNAGLTITKTNSPVSISPPNSLPLSPKTNTSKTNVLKKNKSSLNAVIDKLRVNATSNIDDNSNGNLSHSSLSSTNEINFNKNDSKSEINKLNPGSVSKLNESKIKYNRSEFTVKQSSVGALKLTVTKTKSPSLETKSKTKNLSSKNPMTNSSLFQQKSNNKTSAGIKRQMNNNLKLNQQNKTKSVSPESADLILEAALPKIQLDKLPKIPKTLNSQFSQQQAQIPPQPQPVQQKNNLQIKFLQQQQLKQQQNLLRQQLSFNANSSNNNNSIVNMNSNNSLMNISNMNNNFSNNNFNNNGNNNIATNNQQHFRKFNLSQRSDALPLNSLSSNTSESTSRSENQQFNTSFKTESQTSFYQQQQVNQVFQSQSESNESQGFKNDQNKIITSSQTLSKQINASSKPNNTTSTPSSPMECNVTTDVFQKSPPLIPTETIEETNSSSNHILGSNFKNKNVFEIPTSNLSIQMKKPSLENTIAKLSADKQNSNTSSMFNLQSSSKNILNSNETKKVFVDDEDDEERLCIDVPNLLKKNTSLTMQKPSENKIEAKSMQSQIAKNPALLEKQSLENFIPTSTTVNITSTLISESPVSNNSNSKPSPCFIDDDLMDEALIGSGD